MHHYWTCVEVPNDQDNSFSFSIQLKNETRFILNDCYFTIHKELFEKNPDSDYFYVDLIDNCDKKEAEKKVKRAIDILTYLCGVPYEMDYIREDNNRQIPVIDINYSKAKIERINAINLQYGKIRKKRELLETTLKLFALSTKYTIILDDAEEAFFANFRILEKIAKDEFEIEKSSIKKGREDVKNLVKKIILDNYGIKMPINKIDDLAGNIASEMFDTVFSDVYAKIAWFCVKHGITYDEEILAKAVKCRNALAHGDNVEIKFESDEYSLVVKLADKFIKEKFFTKIRKCYLESRIID